MKLFKLSSQILTMYVIFLLWLSGSPLNWVIPWSQFLLLLALISKIRKIYTLLLKHIVLSSFGDIILSSLTPKCYRSNRNLLVFWFVFVSKLASAKQKHFFNINCNTETARGAHGPSEFSNRPDCVVTWKTAWNGLRKNCWRNLQSSGRTYEGDSLEKSTPGISPWPLLMWVTYPKRPIR